MGDAHADDDWTMTVGKTEFSGEGARAGAKALTHAIPSWRNDQRIVPRGHFRGFEILSKGHEAVKFEGMEERLPDVFLKGPGDLLYQAHLNPENPIGTVQSIEHTLRALDRRAEEDALKIERLEKQLAHYREQAGKPFEHEAKLKELLLRQAELNKALDLDKGERNQVAEAEAQEDGPSTDAERVTASRDQATRCR
jgi:hypothetical protein